MIKIDVEFYHKETEFIEDEYRIYVDENIVFKICNSTDINYISARPFEMQDTLKNHILEKYDFLKTPFQKYDVYFIGRENLPQKPEYNLSDPGKDLTLKN